MLCLVECVANFTLGVPTAYCVYTPLAASSLGSLLADYELDAAAKETLTIDYLTGLAYLHEKGIMHRDISLQNLTVSALDNPRGIIIDLDAATFEEQSVDHQRGTLLYLAPEIWRIKTGSAVLPYNKAVDVWALGICIFSIYSGRRFKWSYFKSTGPPKIDEFDDEAYQGLKQRIATRMQGEDDMRSLQFLRLMQRMIDSTTSTRFTACAALEMARERFSTDIRGAVRLHDRSRKRTLPE